MPNRTNDIVSRTSERIVDREETVATPCPEQYERLSQIDISRLARSQEEHEQIALESVESVRHLPYSSFRETQRSFREAQTATMLRRRLETSPRPFNARDRIFIIECPYSRCSVQQRAIWTPGLDCAESITYRCFDCGRQFCISMIGRLITDKLHPLKKISRRLDVAHGERTQSEIRFPLRSDFLMSLDAPFRTNHFYQNYVRSTTNVRGTTNTGDINE